MPQFYHKVLLQQLGGNKFIAMTGAKNFVKDTNSLSFRITNAKYGINYVKITLNSMDTYDMEFGRIDKSEYRVISYIEGIYNDNLQETFTENTGLDTHL